ncbi:MAG: helix-turn-helix domain-containing protein [Candidatus Cryptobacteroides sp.]
MTKKVVEFNNPERLFGPEQMTRYGYIDKMIFACEMTGDRNVMYDNPLKPRNHIMYVILEGRMDIIVNGNEFSFGKNSFINMPVWSEVGGISYSKDFRALATAAEETIVKDIFQNRNPLPPDFKTLIGFSITSEALSEDETKKISKDINDIITALSDKEHHFVEEISYAYFYIMLTDVADIVFKRYGTGILVHTTDMRRSEGLLKNFVDLLTANIEKETEIGFYAEKLCISKQYLASIVKEKTNATISTVMASMRMQVAAKLLRDPELTIEQIAARLSFSDQSSFGKFFRKHSGMTPRNYRRSLRKTLLTLRPENLMPMAGKDGQELSDLA